jgi:hypothetical protein
MILGLLAGHSEDEVVAILMEKLGISELEARFYIDLELGRTKGDLELIEEDEASGDPELELGETSTQPRY